MLIDYGLDDRKASIAFLGGVVCLASLIAALTIQSSLPSMLAESDNPNLVRMALKLDPGNDRIQHRLGMLYFWSDLDVAKALPLLHRATALNSSQPQYEVDLGTTCEAAGDQNCANQAFAAAARLAPRVPRFQLALANHYLVTGHSHESLQALHAYLQLQPGNFDMVLPTFLRGIGNPDLLWNALPNVNNHAAQLVFISLLTQNDHPERAHLYWKQLATSGATVTLASAVPYLNALGGKSQFAQMTDAWH